MRAAGAASALGVAAGAWALACVSTFSTGAFRPYCPGLSCSSVPDWLLGVVGLVAAALLSASVGGAIGPRRVLYAEALLAALLVVGLGLSSRWMDADYLWVGICLAVAAAGLSFVGGASRYGMSEQANPMNLPVFG